MSGAWVIRKRGEKVERIGWYGYAPAAQTRADALNAEFDTAAYDIEPTP